MSENQKTFRSLSIVEIVVGIILIVEGLIVSTGKLPYFVLGCVTLITAAICYMTVTDASKAQIATIALWITFAVNLVFAVIGLINKSGTGVSTSTEVADGIIALLMLQSLKKLNK